ncbi:MAG: hypothetical protein N2Z22_01535 [Turneriella sp.]|nr:hypothetical protein [Turneriella sp.]
MKRAVIFWLIVVLSLCAFFAPDDTSLEQAVASGKEAHSLFLKYQDHQGDYLLFYDAVGSLLYLRYRRDRWDYSNDALRAKLRRGITYRVECRLLKKLPEGQLPPGLPGAENPRLKELRKIRELRAAYLADLVAVNESALRDLRY